MTPKIFLCKQNSSSLIPLWPPAFHSLKLFCNYWRIGAEARGTALPFSSPTLPPFPFPCSFLLSVLVSHPSFPVSPSLLSSSLSLLCPARGSGIVESSLYRGSGRSSGCQCIFDQLDSWNMSDDNRFRKPTRVYYKKPNVHQPMQNSLPAGGGQVPLTDWTGPWPDCPLDLPLFAKSEISYNAQTSSSCKHKKHNLKWYWKCNNVLIYYWIKTQNETSPTSIRPEQSLSTNKSPISQSSTNPLS